MAITVNDSPGSYIGAANGDILYIVTSNSSSKDNYSYVCDIINESGDRIVRLKQRPNATGIGVFNINDIIKTKVEGDIKFPIPYSGEVFTPSDKSLVWYTVAFGEEWSNTPTSSIFLYNGVTSTAISGATNVAKVDNQHLKDFSYWLNATINRTAIDWQFQYQNHYNQGFLPVAWNENLDKKLSSMPNTNIPLYRDVTSLAFGMFDGQYVTGSNIYVNDICFMNVIQYDVNDNIVTNEIIYNSQDAYGLYSPRANTGDLFGTYSSSFFSSSRDNRLINIGIGEGFFNTPISSSTKSIRIDLGTNVTSSVHYQYLQFDVLDPPCDYPLYQLAWLNEFGIYDYYTFTGRDQYTISRIDNQYTKGFIDYSLTNAGGLTYDNEYRGVTNYSTDYNQVITVSTRFLTQEWADWLEGLFTSPDVYLTNDWEHWLPINLVSADYTKFNDPKSQKLKSYTVQFKYANSPRTR
jgi:hypothetical protein